MIVCIIGLAFWKCPRRKIYAVRNDCDEEGLPSQKKHHVMEDIATIKNDIELIKTFTKDTTTKISLALQEAMQVAFRCTTIPIREPIMIAKCCKRTVGCEQFTDRWYSGLTKRCPLCRVERGFAETMRLNGLAGFLHAMGDVVALNQPMQSDVNVTPNNDTNEM